MSRRYCNIRASSLTTIRPPRVKYVDLRRPVVVRNRSIGNSSAAAEIEAESRSPQCRLRFQSWRTVRRGRCTQHLLRLNLRMAKGERARGLSRPRNSSCPRTGLLMASDVAEARPLAAGSGEGQRLLRTRGARGRSARGPPIKRGAAGPVAHDREAGCARRRTRTSRSGRARSRRLDLGVWLVHARSGYAAMNFSSENTVSRDSM
jgi:hypothetical protein